MASKWFYAHQGRTEGPFSAAQIKELVARRTIQEGDLLWPEGTDPKDAMPPSKALDLFGLQAGAAEGSGPAPPAGHLPDWLDDVQAAERKGPLPGPASTSEVPDWLEDLRLWVGLELYDQPPQPSPAAPEGSAAGRPVPAQRPGLPQWLEGWTLEEKARRSPGKNVSSLIEGWRVEPELSDPSAPPPDPSPLAQLADSVPRTLPLEPLFPEEASPQSEDELVDKTIRETGFDPRTGKIVDPDQFHRWQKAEGAGSSQPGRTNAAVLEVFRQARAAIEHWVDDEKNRSLVLHAELDEIEKNPALGTIFSRYAPFGKQMLDKLNRHLRFLVENRRKFYRARKKSR
jgi:GYF domain 2